MAEMRKGGLKGRALRRSGLKGFEGLDLVSGQKRQGRRKARVLAQIPEGAIEQEGVIVVVEDEMTSDTVGEGIGENPGTDKCVDDHEDLSSLNTQLRMMEEDPLIMKELIPAGISADLALDLIASQPLQDMAFVGEQVIMEVAGKDGKAVETSRGEKGVLVRERPMDAGEEEMVQESFSRLDGEEDFPALSKEGLRIAKEKDKYRGGEGKAGSGSSEQPVKEKESWNRGGRFGGSAGKGNDNKWFGNKNYKATLAEGSGAKGKSNFSFEPGKVRKMGITGESAGLPSIHFSGAETSFLAEKLGYAVVGKFSHSIPSSLHLQKAFMGMRFVGEFSWKYINAKHVLVQFHLIEDYAKLLSGPNGMPVWFVDRHPMRVFKWTPEFDPYFESPIAAVWCNLIGLPIHLFEQSALFAIGGLLGEPLQADHATISRSRLSFARLCIEIDISKTPPQEIILNLQGMEIRQVVKWDRIPMYCLDCKHVGHSRDVCYANG